MPAPSRLFAACLAIIPLLRAEPGRSPGAAAPTSVPTAKPWPAAETINALYQEGNYPAIRRQTAGCVIDPASPGSLAESRLFFQTGDALLREIYRARTLQTPEATTPIEAKRISYELSYTTPGIEALSRVKTLLDEARALDTRHNYDNTTLLTADPGLRRSITLSQGLAAMEKALFATQAPTDFAAVVDAYGMLGRITDGADEALLNTDPYTRNSPEALAACILANIAQGNEAGGLALFRNWRGEKSGSLRRELAVGALAAGFDLVGDYQRTRAFLLTLSAQQVRGDGGRFDPGSQAAGRAAMREHIARAEQALAQVGSTDARSPVLRRARVVGALMLKGALTDDERAYILSVPELTDAYWNRVPGQPAQRHILRLQIGSADPVIALAANEALKKKLTEAPEDNYLRALLGHSLLQAGQPEAAITELTAVVKADVALASVTGALTDRANAYTALGRAEEAAADNRLHAQLQSLLSALAAP